MKKLFLIPIIFLACNQPANVHEAELADLPAGAIKETYEDNPSLVKVTIEQSPGVPLEQGHYLNGRRHGTWTIFHPNELVKSVTTYINGIKEGVHIEIDDRGRLTVKAHYHNDTYDGNYTSYNQTKVVERRYYKNGKLEGVLKKYYDDGSIMEESLYKNGKLNGVAKWYDQQGNVTLQYEYQEGQLVKK